MRATTSSSLAASTKAQRSSCSACKNSIRLRRCGSCRRCRSDSRRHCERSEAIQNVPARLDCFVAIAPRNDESKDRRVTMKRFNLSAWAVSHSALILFLVVALSAAGFFSYQRLGRAEDPFFTVKVVNVSAIWPGATAAEMQTQVADPIEKKLQELPGFEKVQTYSKPAFTAMQVTFRDSTSPKDVPYLFYLLRKKLADVQGQLPAGLLGPVVNDEFSDVDSILYMM